MSDLSGKNAVVLFLPKSRMQRMADFARRKEGRVRIESQYLGLEIGTLQSLSPNGLTAYFHTVGSCDLRCSITCSVYELDDDMT